MDNLYRKEIDDGEQGQEKRQEEAEENCDEEVKSVEREAGLERERDEKGRFAPMDG
jgi:hypothetical protein